MKINLVLLEDTVNSYLTWEKPTAEPLAPCGNLKGHKCIFSNVLNELISTKFAVTAKAILCNSDGVRKGFVLMKL